MLLSPSDLFQAGGIACQYTRINSDTGALECFDAMAVFVTGTTVNASRNISAQSLLSGHMSQKKKFNLGDIVVAWTDKDGRQSGFIAPNGGDAGISIPIEKDGSRKFLNISGEHAFATRNTLLQMLSSGENLNKDMMRALASLEDLFMIALASPDIERFSEKLRGMAFLASMGSTTDVMQHDLSFEDLGRYSSGLDLRQRIQQLDGGRSTFSLPQMSHEDCLESIGVRPSSSKGIFRGALSNVLGGLSRSKGAAPQFLESAHQAISLISGATGDHFGMSEVSGADMALIDESFRSKLLTGPWVRSFSMLLSEIIPGCHTGIFTQDGRDVLFISSEPQSEIVGRGYVASWPTSLRRIMHDADSKTFLNISKEDVPSRKVIEDMMASLKAFAREQQVDIPEGLL